MKIPLPKGTAGRKGPGECRFLPVKSKTGQGDIGLFLSLTDAWAVWLKCRLPCAIARKGHSCCLTRLSCCRRGVVLSGWGRTPATNDPERWGVARLKLVKPRPSSVVLSAGHPCHACLGTSQLPQLLSAYSGIRSVYLQPFTRKDAYLIWESL